MRKGNICPVRKNRSYKKTGFVGLCYSRLQNSRFRTFSERAKRRKRDPRVWSARASHAREILVVWKADSRFLAILAILLRRFYTRSIPFVRIWNVARVRKKYDCFAVCYSIFLEVIGLHGMSFLRVWYHAVLILFDTLFRLISIARYVLRFYLKYWFSRDKD